MQMSLRNNPFIWFLIFTPVIAFAGDTSVNPVFSQPARPRLDNNSITSSHNHSYGTWANLDNPWDYFPPSDSYGRLQMQGMAAAIFRQAQALESAMNRQKPDTARLKQVREVQQTAAEVHDVLRFGSHRGDLGSALGRLNQRLEALTRETAQGSKSGELAEINRLYGQISRVNGRRLAFSQPTDMPKIPNTKSADPIGISSSRIGLSAKNR
ncbi:MAG: hypothetical protein ACKO5E_08075 [bacterium]